MTLHEAIIKLLKEKGTPMTTTEIANALNENKWYLKKDKSEITPFQIHGRTKNYDKLFRRLGNTVYLVTDYLLWQKKINMLTIAFVR